MREPRQKFEYNSSKIREDGAKAWFASVREVWQSRELLVTLLMREISSRYRQSILGYMWALVIPLATVLVFSYLTSKRILPIGDPPLPYPAFAIWNVVVWQLFAGTLVSTTQSLVAAGSLVTKMRFPKETLVFASTGQPLIEFAIKLVPVAIVFSLYDVDFKFAFLLVPFTLIPILCLAIGLGFIFSVANLVIRDTENIVGLITAFGIFLAPILYPPPMSSPFNLVNTLNPFSPLLIASQDLISHGALHHWNIYWPALLFALLTFLGGWHIFRIGLARVIERA